LERRRQAGSAPARARWRRRGGVLAALLALTACATGRDYHTVQALRETGPGAPVRAFVKGNDIRIFAGTGDRARTFKAEWSRLGSGGRVYAYRLAELKVDPTPPNLERTARAWREAEIFGKDAWVNMARSAAERLVPASPGGAALFRLGGREAVLVREEDGTLRKAAPGEAPPHPVVKVTHRDLANAMTALLEEEMAAGGPPLRLFALADLRPEGLVPFVLLDRDRREGVLLFAPRTLTKTGKGPGILSSARSGASLLFESHVLALLKNPISSLGRLLNVLVQGITYPFALGMPDLPDAPPPLYAGPPMDPAAWEARLDRITGRAADCGTFRLLIGGEDFFPAFAERLRGARKSIHLLVGIFDRDDVAVEVADILRERSKEVEVKVVLDRMSSNASGNTQATTPVAEGFEPPTTIAGHLKKDSRVKVRLFLNPWFSAEHSKLFLVDGEWAYLGGMNIGREYRHEWHDLMLEARGPVVAALERDFALAWAHAGPLGDLAYGSATLFGKRPRAGDCTGLPRLRRLYTRTGAKEIRQAVLEAIERARRVVYLENPYLVDHEVTAALARARGRGVDTRVVFPSVTDFLDTDETNIDRANYLLAHGVRVYLYPGMTHVKALVADGWACLGSANFNNLSFRFNQEIDLATSDPALVEMVRAELFEADFARSHNLTEPILVGWTRSLAGLLMDSF